jgi:hypothetical protein
VFQFIFEGLYVGAEEDLISYKIDIMTYVQDVALAYIEGKFL